MHRSTGKISSSPLTITTPTHKPSPRFDHHYDDIQSPQSSTCVRSTSSQDPVLTRSELIEITGSISIFAQHYATFYHSIGKSFHALPFSARCSKWIVYDIRGIIDLAFNVSYYKQLPDLVYIFSEISHRLNESQQMLSEYRADWQASERQLRRCDALLQEAEVRLKFLQDGVWNMWFVVGKDAAVWFDGGDDCRAKAVLQNRWLSVLPQICFANHQENDLQNGPSREDEREWVSWGG